MKIRFDNRVANRACGLFLLAVLCAGFCGCTVQNAPDPGSYITADVDSKRIASVASDTAEFLAWQYKSKDTVFDFAVSPSPADAFGTALRDRLRLHGFSVSENTGNGKRLRYVTDNSGQWIRVILRIDGRIYAKTYDVSGSGQDLKWTSAEDNMTGAK